jgi:dTDP-4-dehydrorhamnose reductase
VAASGASYLVLRTSWVFGRRGRNFLRTMLHLFREREEVSVVNDQHGAPTWSRLIAAGTATAIASLRAPGASIGESMREVRGVYHMASSGATTWHGFATAIRELDPRRDEQKCRIVHAVASDAYPTAARRPRYSLLDSSRLARCLDVSLPGWREQLAMCLADEF